MKPKVDDKRCFANKTVCKAIKACPVEAISYIEVDEPITDKNLKCNCAPATDNPNSCGCNCDDNCGTGQSSCEDFPYGRIIIDYGKCTECGLCVEECCGTAIDLV